MKAHIAISLIVLLAALPLCFALLRRTSGRQFLRVATWIVGGMLISSVLFLSMGYRLTENLTSSLPGHVYSFKLDEPFVKGDLVAFRWHGGATYPRGVIFIKRVVGMPGDEVIRKDRDFWVGSYHVGVAKTHTKAGVPVEPASGGVISPGEYFVATPSKDSLDSRYSLTGNIPQTMILGKAYELF